MRLNRADRSLLSDWWFTIDRLLLSALLLLIIGGLVLSLAASPPVAARLGLDPFHFFKRHLLLAGPVCLILFAASLLSPRQVRRFCLALCGVGLALMVATLFVGPEIKGATRWLQFAGLSLQSSELVKPGFVVLSAWLFSESQQRSDVPCLQLAVALYVIFAGLLVLQPDFGQAFLVTMVWGGLFFMAGLPIVWVAILAGLAVAGVTVAYLTVPHVADRINRFIDPGAGDTYQMDRALQSFIQGGWFGRGPGEGTVKQVLPDSHTDFIFAVAAEEYGLLACLLLVSLFAFIALRGLRYALGETDGFIRYAVAGLMMLFGLQALINMAVNVGLLPAKGMTLPFISYGGSSLISMALTLGMVLGLTRRRPRAAQQSRRASGHEPQGSPSRGLRV
ncbi:MAG: putative lipid II flippase FtsW [Methyloligellaceae bacterium]